MEQGRQLTVSRTPYGCDRLYLSADGVPLHRIRDLGDGRQLKLDPDGEKIIETLGKAAHYRKQKHELAMRVPGDPIKQKLVRYLFRWHFIDGFGGCRIAS